MSKRNGILLWAMLLLCTLAAQGQDRSSVKEQGLQLKYNFSPLASPTFSRFQIGAEYPLKKRRALIGELGIFSGFSSSLAQTDLARENLDIVRGFEAKIGVRRYAKGSFHKATRLYINSWLRFQRKRYEATETIERFGGSFQQTYDVHRARHGLGHFTAFGWQSQLNSKILRWEVDFGFGYELNWRAKTIVGEELSSQLSPEDLEDLQNTEKYFLRLYYTLDLRLNFQL